MNNQSKNKFSYWPYIIIGMLSCTGVINYLLVYYSNSVYSKPVSDSPYFDALKYDAKADELSCAKEKGYDFELVKGANGPELKAIGVFPVAGEVRLEGWSGREELVDEVLYIDEASKTAQIKTPLSSGLWNVEVSGVSKNEVGCSWRVVVRGVV